MPTQPKNVAIIGANKEGLTLLTSLLKDDMTKVSIIVDQNPDAMLFKLMELGYRLSPRYNIRTSKNLEDLRAIKGINVIINVLEDPLTEKFLEGVEFRAIEKLSPMSAKLLWSVRVAAREGTKENKDTHSALLSSLRGISDAVRLTSDRTELLSDILDLAIEVTKAETGSIMLREMGADELRIEVARGMDEEVVRKVRVKLGDGIAGRVAKDGLPLLISGKAKDKEFSHLKERRSVQSALSVPLAVSGGVIGVINVNSIDPAHSFTEADMDFLKTLAGLAAEVIQRSSEHEQMKVDAAKFSLWKELEISMGEKKPLSRRLNAVLKKLSQLVTGLTCFIYLYDDERRRLVLHSSSIKDTPIPGQVNLGYGEGLGGWMIDNMKEVILVDRTTEGMIKRVYIALPMVAKGGLIGAFVGEIISSQGLSKYNESFLKDIAALLSESIYMTKRNEEEILKSKKIVAVDEMGLELMAMKDSKRLLQIIGSASAEILFAEGSLLRISRRGANDFTEVSSFGLDSKKAREHFLPMEKETIAEVARKKEIIMRDFSEEVSPYVRGIISCPLFHEEKVAGFLTLFNKIEEISPYPAAFTRADYDVLKRFAAYIERVFPDIMKGHEAAVDMDVSTPQVFARRVEDEINRARRLGKKTVLVTVRVGGLKGVKGETRNVFLKKLLAFVREKTRSFDTVTMLDEETIGILYPETDEKVMGVLRNMVAMEGPPEFRKGIYYGFATYPDDGDSFEKLIEKASHQVKADFHGI